MALCLLRVYSLARSVLWIWKRGTEYRTAIDNLTEDRRRALADKRRERQELLRIYRRRDIRGDFFPFGVRAIVADNWRHKQLDAGRLRGLLATGAYLAWKWYWFTILFALFIAVVTRFHESLGASARNIIAAAAVVVVAGALSIAAEAALSYITFGSWSLGYHRFDIQPERGVTEVSAFAGGAFGAYMSIAASQAYISAAFRGYEAIQGDSIWERIGLSLYYTFTAFTGNGDAGPRHPTAFLLTWLTYLIAAAFLLIVISLVLGAVSHDFSEKFGRSRPTRRP